MRARRQRRHDGEDGGSLEPGTPGVRARTALGRKVRKAAPPPEGEAGAARPQAEATAARQAGPADDPFAVMTGTAPALAATIQRAQRGDGGATIDDVATAAVEHKGGGQAVDSGVRAQVEPHLGADLGGVRVHTDRDAAAASTAIGARAFAYQNDVFLGAGESPSDVKLMAHELTHVVQQGAATAHAQRKIEVGAANDPAEAEADRVADRVAGGAPAGGGVLVEDGAQAAPHQMTRSQAISQLRQSAGPDAAPTIDGMVAEQGGVGISSLESKVRAAVGVDKPASANDLIAPLAAKLQGGGGVGGAVAGAASAVAGAVGSVVSGIGSLFGFASRKPDSSVGGMIQRLGDGAPLDPTMASAAGEAYGADLSNVRVHAGPAAARAAAEHGARAFTLGNHVAFGAGEHNPGTPVGDAIMAHELAHVVQQDGADPAVQRKPLEVDSGEDAEGAADEAAGGVMARLYGGARAMASSAASRLRGGNGVSLQRCSKTPSAPVTRVVFGIQIVGNGASKAAVDECAAFVTQLLGKNKYAQKKMQEKKVTLVIIPHDKKMTDLPQFAALKGTNTFDGRLWDNVRGSGGIDAPDGTFAIGVPEENLTVIAGAIDGYGPGYSVGMHEFAHSLHDTGLSPAQKTKIDTMYAARKAAGGPWTEAYGSSNEHEYYAQATNCYFGKNAGIGQNGKAWLRTNDPDMCDFLDDLYGKNYDEDGNVVPP